jgi:hypothetical protein
MKLYILTEVGDGVFATLFLLLLRWHSVLWIERIAHIHMLTSELYVEKVYFLCDASENKMEFMFMWQILLFARDFYQDDKKKWERNILHIFSLFSWIIQVCVRMLDVYYISRDMENCKLCTR